MNTKTSLPAAFVLTGAFWVICRNSLYLTQLAERNLAILVLTPESYRQQVEEARRNTHSPVSHITDVAYVEGSLDKEASFNPSVIAALQSWRTQYQIVGAFAVGETLVEPTGLVADALGIRSPGLRATRVCRSKYLQRFYLKAFSPDSVMLPPEQRYHIDLATLAYPLIMKPATRHSSSGVLSIETPEQAHRALADYPAHETLLLEQKIVGQEYSVETLSQQGEVIFASATHKVTTDIRLVDVDLVANSILLCKEGSKTHREWLVPIVSFVRERMRIILDRAIAQGAEPADYLFDVARFLNPLGEVDSEPAIQPVRSFFTRLTKECGFKVSPHRFRHTLATEMMKSPDRNLAMVKGLLGHRSVSTTMEYVELDLKVTGQALENELSLYMDVIPARESEARLVLT